MLRGIGISGLNPKAILLFLALLPQFTDRTGSWPLAAQIGTLGLIHTLSCAAIYLCVGVLARTVLRARPTAARISGVAMILIGSLLLVERLLCVAVRPTRRGVRHLARVRQAAKIHR